MGLSPEPGGSALILGSECQNWIELQDTPSVSRKWENCLVWGKKIPCKKIIYTKCMFSLVRNCRSLFQIGCTILHSHQQWMRVPFGPHHHQHLTVLLSVFWTLVIVINVIVVSCCCFNLHFLDNIWCGVSFHIVACVDLKQIDCQLFLQQRRIYLGSAENCHLGSASMVSQMQVPALQGKENTFIEGKRKLGGLK